MDNITLSTQTIVPMAVINEYKYAKHLSHEPYNIEDINLAP